MSISERLRQAREFAGYTLEKVKECTGIDDSCLSSYERGRAEPKFSQLSKLAELYHVPISFFFEEESQLSQLVLWRNKPQQENEIKAEFLQLCRQYRQLEQWAKDFPGKPLPLLDNYGERFWYPEVEAFAGEVRQHFGLGDRPGETLGTVLEEVYGVKIFYLDLGLLGTAACAKSSLFGEAILLNSQCSRWRRNHDLAHELFHLLTWERFRHAGGVCEPDLQEEKFATCFAGNLLLPGHIVKQAIHKLSDTEGRITLSKLDDVARQFDVSLESLLWRMHFLYNWEEKQTKEYIEEAKKYIEPTERKDESHFSFYPARYQALAIRVFRNGDMSLGQFAKFMNISRRRRSNISIGMLIMKFRLLLLDANVVIYLNELGLWKQFTEQCEITLTKTVVQEVISYDLQPDIESGKIRCVEASMKSIEAFKKQFGPTYLDRMDPGETESLAYLMESREQWQLSSGDEIVYKTLGRLNRTEQGISLEEILQKIGLSRSSLSIQYTKQFRQNVTRKGRIDGVTES